MEQKDTQHRTGIIPLSQQFYKVKDKSEAIDYKAICCFAATGFFLDDDTYFVNRKVCRPASDYRFDSDGYLIESSQYFQWHYSPRDIPFGQALSEFSELLETLVERQTRDKKIILSLSGGLDSRTLAAALFGKSGVYSYSYEFERGVRENRYGRAIAKSAGFQFDAFEIAEGYLWNKINEVAAINQCYSDFTSPRQVAVLDRLHDKGDIFLLGHWGDVLFDDSGLPGAMTEASIMEAVKKKMIKRGGMSLAGRLWETWGLPGTFDDYLGERLSVLLGSIAIADPNARVRALKSLCWAPRWTSIGLLFFRHHKPAAVPYYADEMCRFICTVPEAHLAGRRLQIAYIKEKSKALAGIPWQKYDPCNLYDYDRFNDLQFLPRRAWNKARRLAGEKILGKKFVSRNWELQFCGAENDRSLREYLFDESFYRLVPKILVEEVYTQFQQEPVTGSHPLSMLLTLSLFSRRSIHQDDEQR